MSISLIKAWAAPVVVEAEHQALAAVTEDFAVFIFTLKSTSFTHVFSLDFDPLCLKVAWAALAVPEEPWEVAQDSAEAEHQALAAVAEEDLVAGAVVEVLADPRIPIRDQHRVRITSMLLMRPINAIWKR